MTAPRNYRYLGFFSTGEKAAACFADAFSLCTRRMQIQRGGGRGSSYFSAIRRELRRFVFMLNVTELNSCFSAMIISFLF